MIAFGGGFYIEISDQLCFVVWFIDEQKKGVNGESGEFTNQYVHMTAEKPDYLAMSIAQLSSACTGNVMSTFDTC